ncbi:MAG: cell division protein FtsZ, partial [Caldimonas sp.]
TGAAVSTLTVALASLGGIVLAGVIAHGAWQARRAGPKRASPLVREEPSASAPRDRDSAAERSDAGDDDAFADLSETTAQRRHSKRLPLQLDALVDAFAPITLDAPLAGEAVLQHLPSRRHVGSKLVIVEGLDAETGEWEVVAPGRRYGELQAGVQLASRTGPLNEIEYSEFVQRMQAFAEAIGAGIDVPDMLDVMARAKELDAFAGQHDAQLAVHLHARGAAWSVGYIQQHARRHGFVPGVVPGRLVYPSAEEGAPPVLTLTFDSQAALADEPDRAAVRDVTLAFDVPQTDPVVEPFRAWQAAAQALAVGMDADIVDDDERPLSSAGFDSIGARLGELYTALAARDLAAGSASARRLFS